MLFAGDPVIHIDNCERAISGDFLCSMLTQEIVQARILGLSERRILPSTALILASGNNLTLLVTPHAVPSSVGSMHKSNGRTHECSILIVMPMYLATQPELVIAGLTILRAYHLAGRPQTLTPMGSFTDWNGSVVHSSGSVVQTPPIRVKAFWKTTLGRMNFLR